MTLNKFVFTVVGSAAMAATAFGGTASSGKYVQPQVAPAEEDLGLTLGVGYDTHYFFRGLNLAEDWVSTSVDWTLPLTKGLRLDLGANYGTSAGDSAKLGKYDAGDLSNLVGFDVGNISYDRLQLDANLVATLGPVEVGVGYRWYHNLGDLARAMEDGNEVGVNVATKLGPINLGVAAYRDFSTDGWYFEAAVNTEIKLCERVSLVPGANVGYADHYSYQFSALGFRPEVDSFTTVTVSLAMPIKLTKRATLTPYVAGNLPLNDLRKYADVIPLQDNQLYGGVNLSVKF